MCGDFRLCKYSEMRYYLDFIFPRGKYDDAVDFVAYYISISGMKNRWRIPMTPMENKRIENTRPFDEYERASGMSSVMTMYIMAPEEKPNLRRMNERMRERERERG